MARRRRTSSRSSAQRRASPQPQSAAAIVRQQREEKETARKEQAAAYKKSSRQLKREQRKQAKAERRGTMTDAEKKEASRIIQERSRLARQEPEIRQAAKEHRREKWLGTKPQDVAVPLHTPEGMAALQALLQQGLAGIQNPLAGFEPIKQNVLKTLQQETIPSIAQRFASMRGGESALNSSGLIGALGQSLENANTRLGALGSEYALRNRQGLLDMLQLGLTPQYDYETVPGQPGNIEKYLLPAARGASQFLNLIPFAGPALNAGAQTALDIGQSKVAQRRGENVDPNLQANIGNLGYGIMSGVRQSAQQKAQQQLQDWNKARRNRAQTYNQLGTMSSLSPYGTSSFSSLPGGY